MTKVKIDTSAWIESFQPQGDLKLKEKVKQLIIERSALLNGLRRWIREQERRQKGDTKTCMNCLNFQCKTSVAAKVPL